jgi:hypothetical protein
MMRVVAQQGAWASSTKGRNRCRRTSWPLPLIEVDAGTVLYRLTRLHFPDPAYFGRAALFRFDAPDRSFGVCYLGTTQSAQDARSIHGARALWCERGLRRAVTVSRLRELAMPKLRVHNFAISLDGYAAGPNQSHDHPLGVGGEKLHE